MTLNFKKLPVAVAALALSVGCGQGRIGASTNDAVTDDRPEEIQALPTFPSRAVCPDTGVPGEMHCNAHIRTDATGDVHPDATTVDGLSPSDLQSAYKIPSGGSGLTIAIVDAYDDPDAESDLATYRSHFGLPACTTANGCFKKVNQNGSTSSLPTADKGWSGEIALDLDMVSAACPSCKILLVEVTSPTDANLGKGVDTAVSLGAAAVSNSYGGSESSGDTSSNTHYNHPGVIITASAGDDGYGVEYPASSPYVTAVGGTTLAKSSSASRGWVESAWGSSSNANGGTGSGCSSYETKPSWQTASTNCSKRAVADISAVADPNSGVAVYDGYGSGGWQVYGGTSAASPLVAAILAVTGHQSDALGFAYSHTSDFYDVTSGQNGGCGNLLCKSGSGWDGPTGIGTPNGTALASSHSTTGSSSTGSTGSGSTSGTTGSGSTTGSTTGSTGSTTGSTGSSGSGSTLEDGVPVTGISGGTSSHTYYTVNVPSGSSSLNVKISGGSGNANLYVKKGTTVSGTNYDCRSISSNDTDSCTISSPAAGTYSVMILGNKAYSGLTLEADY